MPRSYKCAECRAVFKLARSLKAHMRTHAADMPYQCEVCLLCFSHANNLARHMRCHTGESPYKFGRCDLSFAQLRSIQWHRVHDKKRPFQSAIVHTDECDIAFTQLISLQRHQKTTHDENRPFPCHLCSCRFNRESDLTRHRRKAHPSEPTTQSVAVHTHPEPVGMVTVTTQTRVSSGNTTTISTVTSPIGSAYVFTTYNPSATTTTVTQGSGLVTTNTDPNFPGSDSGNIHEEIPDSELARYDYDPDDLFSDFPD